MDSNKLEKLKELGYTIRRVCRNCSFFTRGGWSKKGVFGTCSMHKYSHLKHTDAVRDLSVHETGGCGQHQWNPNIINAMHAFAQFTEEGCDFCRGQVLVNICPECERDIRK